MRRAQGEEKRTCSSSTEAAKIKPGAGQHARIVGRSVRQCGLVLDMWPHGGHTVQARYLCGADHADAVGGLDRRINNAVQEARKAI